jgi:hypothetical protein
MLFRVRFSPAGEHVLCRLFVAPGPNQTFAPCGEFTVRRGAEFKALVHSFNEVEFVGTGEFGLMAAGKEKRT